MAGGGKGSATYKAAARTRKANTASGADAKFFRQQQAAERAMKAGGGVRAVQKAAKGRGVGSGALRAAAPRGPKYKVGDYVKTRDGTFQVTDVGKKTYTLRGYSARIHGQESYAPHATVHSDGKLWMRGAVTAKSPSGAKYEHQPKGKVGTSWPSKDAAKASMSARDSRTNKKGPSRRATSSKLIATAARDAGAWHTRINSPEFSAKPAAKK